MIKGIARIKTRNEMMRMLISIMGRETQNTSTMRDKTNNKEKLRKGNMSKMNKETKKRMKEVTGIRMIQEIRSISKTDNR